MNTNELEALQMKVGKAQTQMTTRLENLRKAQYQPGKTFEQAQAVRDQLALEAGQAIDAAYASLKELVSVYRETHINPASAKKLEIW
jgi:hypothetical protein